MNQQQCGQLAGGEGGAQGGILGMLFPLALFVLIFYFFIIRPQKKRQKQHDELLASMTRGDQVVTAGGFFGYIREVKEAIYLDEERLAFQSKMKMSCLLDAMENNEIFQRIETEKLGLRQQQDQIQARRKAVEGGEEAVMAAGQGGGAGKA